MTRKLAVTVFVMSLTLVGCGSSSPSKPDVGADTKAPVADVNVLSPDTVVQPQPGPEAGTPDTAQVQPDAALDTGIDTPRPDAAVVDLAGGEAGPVVPDTRLPDTGTVKLDGGVDVPPVKVDAPDAAVVDAPNAGDGSAVETGTGDGGDGGQD